MSESVDECTQVVQERRGGEGGGQSGLSHPDKAVTQSRFNAIDRVDIVIGFLSLHSSKPSILLAMSTTQTIQRMEVCFASLAMDSKLS